MADVHDLEQARMRRTMEDVKQRVAERQYRGLENDVRLTDLDISFSTHVLGRGSDLEPVLSILFTEYDPDAGASHVGALRLTESQWRKMVKDGDAILAAHNAAWDEE